MRDDSVIGDFRNAAEEHETKSRHQESAAAREQNAAHQNRKQVQRDEIAILRATGVNNAGDDSQIQSDLKRCMPSALRKGALYEQIQRRKEIPQDRQTE